MPNVMVLILIMLMGTFSLFYFAYVIMDCKKNKWKHCVFLSIILIFCFSLISWLIIARDCPVETERYYYSRSIKMDNGTLISYFVFINNSDKLVTVETNKIFSGAVPEKSIIKVILHKTYHKGILWHTIGTKDSPEYKIFVPGSKGYKEAKKRVIEN